jgi:hypothetical protein
MDEKCPYEDQSCNPFHYACKDCRDQACGRSQLILHVIKAPIEDGESVPNHGLI